jgi:hypothetical protein
MASSCRIFRKEPLAGPGVARAEPSTFPTSSLIKEGSRDPALIALGRGSRFGEPLAGMNCVQLTFRSARVGTFAGDKPHRSREDNNAQVDCCCCRWLSSHSLGTGTNTRAASSAGRHDHASSLRMRPR